MLNTYKLEDLELTWIFNATYLGRVKSSPSASQRKHFPQTMADLHLYNLKACALKPETIFSLTPPEPLRNTILRQSKLPSRVATAFRIFWWMKPARYHGFRDQVKFIYIL